MGTGIWRLEVEVQDGRVSWIWRRNKLHGTDLDAWSLALRAPDEPEA
jgi:hypothetical protein